MDNVLDKGALFKCPVCGNDQIHHFQTPRRLQSDIHEYKCPNCGATFKTHDDRTYELAAFPDDYSYTATFYKGDVRLPEQWDTAAILPNSQIDDAAEGDILFTPSLRATDPPIVLQRDEIAFVSWGGWTYSEIASRTIRTSLPVSMRVARGMRVFIPSSSRTEAFLKPLDIGTFVLTNKRYAFIGHNKSVSAKLDKVLAVETYLDGFSIARSGKQKIEFFTGRPGLLFGTMVRAMLRELNLPFQQPTIVIDVPASTPKELTP